MEHDYAKALRQQAWLRHPSLGDPSFDAFEKIGDTVHRSRPPYEWAVNGSLFRDPPTGDWYLTPVSIPTATLTPSIQDIS